MRGWKPTASAKRPSTQCSPANGPFPPRAHFTRLARELPASAPFAVLDGDPFKGLWYNWVYAGEGWEGVETVAALYRERVAETERLIRSHIGANPGPGERRDLLLPIAGIGDATAAKPLGEIPDVKRYEGARRLAASAGLGPRLHESAGGVRREARLSMRKLVHVAYGVLKSGRPFDPELKTA